MRLETRRLGQVLLDHHRTVRKPPGSRISDREVNQALIAYHTLCERAGVSWILRSVGLLGRNGVVV